MRSALITLLVAALLAPAVAAAQFQPLPPAPPPEPPPLPAVPGSEESGISGLQEALLILAGVVVVVGIGVAITRDARRNAPAETRPGAGGPSSSGAGSVGERKKPDPRIARKQKAAAKRARQARKKNRPARK